MALRGLPVPAGTVAGVSSAFLIFACSSSNGASAPGSVEYTAPDGATSALESPGTCSTSGGPVSGPPDDHCVAPDGGGIVQTTTAAGCTAGGDGGGVAMGTGDDGGGAAVNDGTCGDPAYGPALHGSFGSDDDCKYDVAWTSTPICVGQPVYFTVLATRRADDSPLTAASPVPDVVLDCGKAVIDQRLVRSPSPEVAPGTYVVGPVVFPESGRWVFRLHFDEQCLDVEDDSPHGHAAFWVNVP